MEKRIITPQNLGLMESLGYEKFFIELEELLRTDKIVSDFLARQIALFFYKDQKREVQRNPDNSLADKIEHQKEMAQDIARLIKQEYRERYIKYFEAVAYLHDVREDSANGESTINIRISKSRKKESVPDKPLLYLTNFFCAPVPFMVHQLTRYDGESVEANSKRITDFNYFKKNFIPPYTLSRKDDLNSERANFFVTTLLLRMLDNKNNYTWGLKPLDYEDAQYYLDKATTYLHLNQKIGNIFHLYNETTNSIFDEDKVFNEIETTIQLLENYADRMRKDLEMYRKIEHYEPSFNPVLVGSF